jgi:hypothetical protein
MYKIRIINAHTQRSLRVFNYRAVGDVQQNRSDSTQSKKRISIAVGGDVAITAKSRQLLRRLAKNHDIDVFVVGGDVAYDDGLRACYLSWDTWFDMFESELFAPLGRIVPFIIGFGNHDVGYNSLQNVHVDLTPENRPLIFDYFPQQDAHRRQTALPN